MAQSSAVISATSGSIYCCVSCEARLYKHVYSMYTSPTRGSKMCSFTTTAFHYYSLLEFILVLALFSDTNAKLRNHTAFASATATDQMFLEKINA